MAARATQQYLRSVEVPHEPAPWVSCKSMYEQAKRTPRDLGRMEIARSNPLSAHAVLHAKLRQGRKHRNRQGLPAHNSDIRHHAKREHGRWLLIASPCLKLIARQLVTLYARRMQIELAFRDVELHR